MPNMVQVNFTRPFPVFPLAGVCLLPHTTIPLHVGEPRYVQMVRDALDGRGQVAVATFDGDQWTHEYHGNPPIRPIVCVGQIEQHERLPLNKYNILLQGICRARIVDQIMPDEQRPYRLVKLEPLEPDPGTHEPALVGWRNRVKNLLTDEPLTQLRFQPNVLEWFDRDDIPSHVLIEIVGHLLMTTTDDVERRYALLAEPDTLERAAYTENQLRDLERIIESARDQRRQWPKGLSWN